MRFIFLICFVVTGCGSFGKIDLGSDDTTNRREASRMQTICGRYVCTVWQNNEHVGTIQLGTPWRRK